MLSLRKHRISRPEEFSHAVFGFALTLLVLSTTVPRSYDQLIDLLKGLPAFACCFALLVWIWHEHAALFERYPLTDGMTVELNSVLLFVVLVIPLPLAFLSPSSFALMGPLHAINGRLAARRRAEFISGLPAETRGV